MDFTEVIRTRRSVRSFKPDPVPDEVLAQVLDAARLAPSACNKQPWHFIVVRDPAKRRGLAQAAAGQAFVGEAPVVLLCCGQRYRDRYCWIGTDMYLVDCAIAIDHLTLAARNEGLGTCWVGAFDHGEVRRVVKVADDYDVIMLVPLGYPAAAGAFHETNGRHALKQVMSEG